MISAFRVRSASSELGLRVRVEFRVTQSSAKKLTKMPKSWYISYPKNWSVILRMKISLVLE